MVWGGLNSIPSPSSLPRSQGLGWKLQLSNHKVDFPGNHTHSVVIYGLTKNHLRSINSGGVWKGLPLKNKRHSLTFILELFQELSKKDHTLWQKMSPLFLPVRKLQGFLGALCQECNEDQTYISNYKSQHYT